MFIWMEAGKRAFFHQRLYSRYNFRNSRGIKEKKQRRIIEVHLGTRGSNKISFYNHRRE